MKSKFLLLNIIAFACVVLSFFLGMTIQERSEMDNRILACQKGYRFAAARYKVFKTVPVKEIIKDSKENACWKWSLK